MTPREFQAQFGRSRRPWRRGVYHGPRGRWRRLRRGRGGLDARGPRGMRRPLRADTRGGNGASTRVRGTGFVVGEHKVTNEMLTRITDTTDQWIRERSGIETRYFVEEGTATSDLAVPAAQKALADAGLTKDDVDYIVFATMTPDYYFPG